MELRLYSPALSAVRDDVVALRAEERYDGPGTCTVRLKGRVEAAPGDLVTVPGTRDGFVLTAVTDGSEGGTSLTGFGPLALFSRALLPEERTLAGPAAEVLAALAAELGAPALPLPLMTLAPAGTAEIALTAGPCTLADAVAEVCAQARCGVRLTFSPEGFVFSAEPLRDADFFLSDSLGNLRSLTRTRDDGRYATRVLVVGQGGVSVTVGSPAVPLRDAILFSSDASTARLRRQGERYLAAHGRTETVAVSADVPIPPGTRVAVRCGDPPVLAQALCTRTTLTLRDGRTAAESGLEIVREPDGS